MLTMTITVLNEKKKIISVDYRTRGVGTVSLSSVSSESAEVAAQAHFVAYDLMFKLKLKAAILRNSWLICVTITHNSIANAR